MTVTQLQLRRGTTGQCVAMTPAQGEPIYDTTLLTLRLGDGVQAGGYILPRLDSSGNLTYSSITATFSQVVSATFNFTGNGTIGGTLGVTGLATLASASVGALTVTGHATLEGVTSTGATGTGKLVFDTGPTISNAVVGTQTAGDSTTKAASTAFVAAAIVQFDGINKIINGSLVIDQRAAGASVTPTVTGYFTCDRWAASITQASKLAFQQNANAIAPPAGFSYYMGITSASAYTVLSSDAFNMQQSIEGFNCADLNWGAANAQPVTLSFWVRSSLTGTFSGSLRNAGNTRSYPFTYAIGVSNTWTKISITIAGDTSGTWNIASGVGICVLFNLGAGITNLGTAGAWTSGNFAGATSSVNLVGTNGATLYLTGVQLETGSVATGFDNRPYGSEFALCQRYFQRYVDPPLRGVVTGTNSAARMGMVLNTAMRAAPTAVMSGGPLVFDGTANTGAATISVSYTTPQTVELDLNLSASGYTLGRVACMYTSASGVLALSAEL